MKDRLPIRVLIVDDDEEDAAILARYMGGLERHTVHTEHASGEQDARDCLASGGVDLVFLDLNLKGRDGLDLLRDFQARGVDVPVIVVTGSGDEMKAVQAMKAGAYDYLVKDSLSSDLLDRTIRHARQRHFLERERVRMVHKLAELSITDELTRLANRRYLIRKLEEEVARSRRTGHSFGLLMVDLDHFKRVNDEHGHQVGDDALKLCGAALRRNVRRTDFVARYGGEEFCIVLPETDVAGAAHVGEKLRRAVGALPDPIPTISVGVACWQAGDTVEDLIRRADEAAYDAKRLGRDRVAVRDGSEVGAPGQGTPSG